MNNAKVLWFIYKRIRTSLGLSFGLILMYGAYNGVIGYELLLVALGFMFLHLFGDCYNDYWDYDDDVRNKRFEKLTTGGALSKDNLRNLSFFILAFGLVFLYFTSFQLLFAGISYAVLLWAYSNPLIRLKKYDVLGYALTEIPWLFMPILLDGLFLIPHSRYTVAFMSFYFFQYLYLLCQKDSTDIEDTTNLFIRRGWRTASFLCIFFALLSSYSLFQISALKYSLVFIWVLNLGVKVMNVEKIYRKRIGRSERGNFVLMEFLTPYLFVLGGFL